MSNTIASRNQALFKTLLFAFLLLPALNLLWQFLYGDLGVNPVETLLHETGEWALRILLLTLAMSPLQKLYRSFPFINYRRMIGLYSFFYAFLHFLIYVGVDQWWDLEAIIEDIYERPYITIGFAAFVLLIPLAITSTQRMRRRMQMNWVRLHRAIYLIAILGVIHFWWLVKADVQEPLIYAGILFVLLAYRMVQRIRFSYSQQRSVSS